MATEQKSEVSIKRAVRGTLVPFNCRLGLTRQGGKNCFPAVLFGSHVGVWRAKFKPYDERVQHTVRLVFCCEADVGRDATPIVKIGSSTQPVVQPAVLLLGLWPGEQMDGAQVEYRLTATRGGGHVRQWCIGRDEVAGTRTCLMDRRRRGRNSALSVASSAPH